jgi:hypothetical protein
MTVDWRGWSRGQWALRLVVVAGSALALFSRTPSLGAPQPWIAVIVVALAVGWALFPESVVGSVTLLAVGFSWASSDVTEVPVAALVASLGMLAAHVAAVVVSYGPARLPVDLRVARLWALRGGGAFGAAVLVWVLARTVADLPDSGSVWVLGLVVTLSVVVVAAAAIQAANPREDV